MRPRGGTVDGVHLDSIRKIAQTVGVSYYDIKHHIEAGDEFDVQGYHVVMDPSPIRELSAPTPPRPLIPDPLAAALRERSLYDHGVYHGAGLIRRTA